MTAVIVPGVLLLMAMYLSPALIAIGRNAHLAWAVAVFNLVFGWTILGWIAALIWSLLARPSLPQPIAAHADLESEWGGAPLPAFGRGDIRLFGQPVGEPRA